MPPLRVPARPCASLARPCGITPAAAPGADASDRSDAVAHAAAPLPHPRVAARGSAGAAPRALAARRPLHASTPSRSEEETAAAPADSQGFLAKHGFDDPLFAIPVGIILAVPILANEVLVLSEETQLVGCFVFFSTCFAKFGGGAVGEMLDQKGIDIVAEHNAIEDQSIAAVKSVIETHKTRVSLKADVATFAAAQEEYLGALNAGHKYQLQHNVRDGIVAQLDELARKEQSVRDEIQANLVSSVADSVAASFASDKTAKSKAMASALGAIAAPGSVPADDGVGALFSKALKAHSKVKATEPDAATVADNEAELAAIKARFGLEGL